MVLRRGKFLSPAAQRFLEMFEPDRPAAGRVI